MNVMALLSESLNCSPAVDPSQVILVTASQAQGATLEWSHGQQVCLGTVRGRMRSPKVKDVAIIRAGGILHRSPMVDKALQELPQMLLTEACVSGLCDICLYQTVFCNIVGKHWADSQPSRHSAK
jgi:hypothetical protein